MARLADTSVFIALERRGGTLSDLEAIARGELLALASISASELLAGGYRSSPAERRLKRLGFVETLLRHLPAISFDLEAARVHARIVAELEAAGQSIGHNDAIIAATALAHDYIVVTHNLRHFQRVPGLAVEAAAW